MNSKLALVLFHGREAVDTDLEGWGEDGPIFVGIESFSWTYGNITLYLSNDEPMGELNTHEDMFYYDGMFYGDASIIPISDIVDLNEKRIVKFEDSKNGYITKGNQGTFDPIQHQINLLELKANEHKVFILRSEDELIATVKLIADKHQFYKNIRLAIAEHYCCEHDDVSILDNPSDDFTEKPFDVETVEDGEPSVREFTLELSTLY